MEPDTSEATSMRRLRQEAKLDKFVTLYRHLGITRNPLDSTWIDLGLQRIQKKEPQFLSFTTVIDGFL